GARRAAFDSDHTATMSVEGDFVVGGTVTYTVEMYDGAGGMNDAPGHEVTIVFPAQLQVVSVDANGGTASNSGNTVNWDFAIDMGGTDILTITAQVVGSGTISAQGTYNYDADGNNT